MTTDMEKGDSLSGLVIGSIVPLNVVLVLYVVFSVLAVIFYFRDKRSAERGEWRTPEITLHFLELFGGWPGAFLAQQLFRHKTQKTSFLAVFWLIVALHLVLWADYFTNGRVLNWVISQIGNGEKKPAST